jgi:hypothetical protein
MATCENEPVLNQRDPLACLGAELLRRAEESQPVLERAWNELMANWGIHGQPVGVERLRDLIQEECGTSSKDNAFSREVIDLREERP